MSCCCNTYSLTHVASQQPPPLLLLLLLLAAFHATWSAGISCAHALCAATTCRYRPRSAAAASYCTFSCGLTDMSPALPAAAVPPPSLLLMLLVLLPNPVLLPLSALVALTALVLLLLAVVGKWPRAVCCVVRYLSRMLSSCCAACCRRAAWGYEGAASPEGPPIMRQAELGVPPVAIWEVSRRVRSAWAACAVAAAAWNAAAERC